MGASKKRFDAEHFYTETTHLHHVMQWSCSPPPLYSIVLLCFLPRVLYIIIQMIPSTRPTYIVIKCGVGIP